jgi:hypothetical protein
MATHHGKEGVVKTGANITGEVTSFTLETSADVVEDTALSDSAKTFLAGRTSFSGTVDVVLMKLILHKKNVLLVLV